MRLRATKSEDTWHWRKRDAKANSYGRESDKRSNGLSHRNRTNKHSRTHDPPESAFLARGTLVGPLNGGNTPRGAVEAHGGAVLRLEATGSAGEAAVAQLGGECAVAADLAEGRPGKGRNTAGGTVEAGHGAPPGLVLAPGAWRAVGGVKAGTTVGAFCGRTDEQHAELGEGGGTNIDESRYGGRGNDDKNKKMEKKQQMETGE